LFAFSKRAARLSAALKIRYASLPPSRYVPDEAGAGASFTKNVKG